jgi:predicted phosphate transport protein (TIGR00153 family)
MSLLGTSPDKRCAELLMQLVATAVACAEHLHKTNGQDMQTVIEHEHAGDIIEGNIRVFLDSIFIMRFDKEDVAQLAWEIDEIIDRMRKIAAHIHVYQKHLGTLRPDAVRLLSIIKSTAQHVHTLIGMLTMKPIPLDKAVIPVRHLEDAESEADALFLSAEIELAKEFDREDANPVAFHAWVRLYHLLEQATDDANHCGSRIMSIARKEA